MAPLALTIGLFWLALFHVLPAVLVLGSQRPSAKDRNLWAIGVLFTSWLGFIAFMIVTTLEASQRPIEAESQYRRQRSATALDISDHRHG